MSAKFRRLLIVGAWLSVVIAWFTVARSTGDSPIDIAQSFVDTVRGAWWAVAAFVLFYAARPIVLFPATVLTIAGGLLFGPGVGIAATIVGANLSAMVAYWIGRSLTAPASEDGSEQRARWERLNRWTDRMRANSFSTVMTMRFVFLPYDLVSYLSGFLRIAPLQFLAATALGSLPGTVAFVLAGASIERLDDGVGGLDLRVLALSVVIFVASLIAPRVLKRREAVRESQPASIESAHLSNIPSKVESP